MFLTFFSKRPRWFNAISSFWVGYPSACTFVTFVFALCVLIPTGWAFGAFLLCIDIFSYITLVTSKIEQKEKKNKKKKKNRRLDLGIGFYWLHFFCIIWTWTYQSDLISLTSPVHSLHLSLPSVSWYQPVGHSVQSCFLLEYFPLSHLELVRRIGQEKKNKKNKKK